MIPSGWELVVVVGVVLLLFGGKKIPELAKGLGKGIKDFKQAVKEDDDAPAQSAAKEIEGGTETASAEKSVEAEKSEKA